MCIQCIYELFNKYDMMVSTHKLHDLLPLTVNQIQDRETRLNGDKIYNFNPQNGLKIARLSMP